MVRRCLPPNNNVGRLRILERSEGLQLFLRAAGWTLVFIPSTSLPEELWVFEEAVQEPDEVAAMSASGGGGMV